MRLGRKDSKDKTPYFYVGREGKRKDETVEGTRGWSLALFAVAWPPPVGARPNLQLGPRQQQLILVGFPPPSSKNKQNKITDKDIYPMHPKPHPTTVLAAQSHRHVA